MFIGGVQEPIDQAGAALLHDPRGLGFLPILENFVISLVAHGILHLRSAPTVKQLRSIVHSSELTIVSQFLQRIKLEAGRRPHFAQTNVPLSIQYEITDDAMTAQFETEPMTLEDMMLSSVRLLGIDGNRTVNTYTDRYGNTTGWIGGKYISTYGDGYGGTTGTIGNKPISTYGDGYGYTRGTIGRDQVNTYTDRSGFTTGTIGRGRVNCFTDRLRTTKCY